MMFKRNASRAAKTEHLYSQETTGQVVGTWECNSPAWADCAPFDFNLSQIVNWSIKTLKCNKNDTKQGILSTK